MGKGKKSCGECGAPIVEYHHRLSIPLVRGLLTLDAAGGGPINLKELTTLTRNEWNNFQKLRYFDLVVGSCHEDGSRIGGVWEITDLGVAFLDGQVKVPEFAWTYRGDVVSHDGGLVNIHDVMGSDAFYQHREEWAAESQPHTS